MIPLAVGDGSGGVGVGRKVMELCDSIVRALWHGVFLNRLDAAIEPVQLVAASQAVLIRGAVTGARTENTHRLSGALFLGSLLGSWRRQAVATLGMQFRSFSVVMNCVLIVPVSQVCVVRSLFVLLGCIVFRCLFVVEGCPLMMSSSLLVMLPSL
jgi:hypothetical protein